MYVLVYLFVGLGKAAADGVVGSEHSMVHGAALCMPVVSDQLVPVKC